MATEKAQTLNALKTKILNETLTNEGRDKYGLFSYPPAGVSGMENYDFTVSRKLDQSGKPLTKPRGIFAGPPKTGKIVSSYFSKPEYVTIGDKYVDPDSKERQYQNEKKKKIKHEAQFKPSDQSKTDPFKALFKHMTDHADRKKTYRGPDGKVITHPKNITTNPPKYGHGDTTVGHLLSKTLPHLAEPYNRPKELAAKELAEHKKKLQEAPFRTTSYGNNLFNSHKRTFGKDDKVLDPLKPRTLSPSKKLHEMEFKPSNPSKHGYNKTIGKFPKYMDNPIKAPVRKVPDPSEKRDAFKPNDRAFEVRPTPSVSLNRQNLRNEMARISQSLV
jgi:hypothetical protein